MITVPEAGGVKVMGDGAVNWGVSGFNLISSVPSSFDPGVSEPKYNASRAKFLLPARRGQHDYTIHLLETKEALIIKNGKMFLCTRRNGKPEVLTFSSTQAVAQVAQVCG